MKPQRWMRWGLLVGGAMCLFQTTSCLALEALQTVFLGITAAGAVGILRNL